MKSKTPWIQVSALLLLMPAAALAGKLICPDTLDDAKHREVMATSSPEVKVRASAQGDSKRWLEVIRPLTQKAVKQAKTQRAELIQQGIEHSCTLPQQYVGQIIPVPDRASGCESRVVTRPGESDFIWVQVIATCKYDWACCTPESLPGAVGAAVGYTLEGPLTQGSTTPAKK